MNLIRSVAERLSRGRVLKRRLPPDLGGGRLYVTPDAALRFWRKDLGMVDPALLNAARELVKPGDVVWDIGANVGLFCFAAAARAGSRGEILAVEPDLWLVGLLRRSVEEQPDGSAPVRVLGVAAGDSVGVAEFCIAARGRAANHLLGYGGSQTGGTRDKQFVVTVTLDWLMERFRPPAVLKIDVEGAEELVLRGGRQILSQAKPAVLIEVYEENAEAVGSLLREYGYKFYDAELPREQRRPLKRPAYNTIAIAVR